MYPVSFRRRAVGLYRSGCSYREIAERLKVSYPTAWLWAHPGYPASGTRRNSGRVRAMSTRKEKPLEPGKEQMEDERRAVDALPDDPKVLKRLLLRAHAERDVFRLEAEVLKGRGGSWDFSRTPSTISLSTREKTRIAKRLHEGSHYRLALLYQILCLDDSTYYYERKALKKPDRHKSLRGWVLDCWEKCRGRWGYRRIRHWIMEQSGRTHLSEKLVRSLMTGLGLLPIYVHSTKHYNSYKGELSPAPPNLVKRGFHAARPNMLWLTDISMFMVDGVKAYLSAIIDCFDGMVVSWKLSRRPDARLANGSLLDAIKTLHPGEHPIIHSDRGCHYRWKRWKAICDRHGLVRSMSAKSCSPDNAAMEGFFYRLKNKFFYYRDWRGISFDSFKGQLGDWIHYYNMKREKQLLGWKSPVQYRLGLGLAI